ncbi:MAG TPA: PLP-dependent cysteine synthase family protein [Planctomycetota bacterium]|jgi:cysteine synthase|nr:PLP-dependent cysteine synthase family protein [Planctomycetota bacterium]
MPDIKESILDCVGRTPLIRLGRMFRKQGVEILAKHEGLNPCGSVKERIAVAMLEGAERDGQLRPGMTLVESSSGNTGIGLAMAAAVKGYPCLITMAKKVSRERRQYIRAFGAQLCLVDGGSDQAWDRADEIAASDPKKYFRIHQYRMRHNADAHYRTTAPEIWEQTGGKLDVFVATLGTTGTLVGCSRYFRERNPGIRIVSVEPTPKNEQQGLRNLSVQRVPEIWDPASVDERMISEDGPSFRLARELATKEGIFAGISSGSAVWGALEQARRLSEGTVVVVLPDSGARYLSTPLFDFADDPQVHA